MWNQTSVGTKGLSFLSKKVAPHEMIFLIILLAGQCVLMWCAHRPFNPTAMNSKETHKSLTKLQELKWESQEQKHWGITMLFKMFLTSRAFVEAGGLCSSRANIPIRKARLWYSSRSLSTVSRKAALDKVLVAIHVCLLVDTLFFLPCLKRNLSQDTKHPKWLYACPLTLYNNH